MVDFLGKYMSLAGKAVKMSINYCFLYVVLVSYFRRTIVNLQIKLEFFRANKIYTY